MRGSAKATAALFPQEDEVVKQLTLIGGRALIPDGALHEAPLSLDDGKIAGIGTTAAGDTLELAGGIVLPGLIDLHTHGLQMTSTDAETLHEFARLAASHGATTIFPTYFAPPEVSTAQMRRHRKTSDDLRALPQIGGFRLESPYLIYAGAGVNNDLAPIDRATTDLLLEAGGGHVRLWDISPELPGALETIADLSRQGIVCSLAHTRASIEQARAAVEAGARLVTHLFDTFVVPQETDPGVYPVGLIDYLLVEDRLTCEIIADGTHVYPLLLEKALRCKTPARIAVVTDSNFGAGLPPGDYQLPNDWGRARIAGPNDGVRLIDREMGLAGRVGEGGGKRAPPIKLGGRNLIPESALNELSLA
jgi:N-acetylglucosamine-6-phosphate deacetylase